MSFCNGEHSEFYQLVNCTDGQVFQLNGLPARFEFTGISLDQFHPDLLLGKVISNVVDIDLNAYAGCWTFVESENFPAYTTIPYENFFNDVTQECDCSDCLPNPEPEPYIPPTPKIIYPETFTGDCDAGHVEKVMCNYSDASFKSMMSKRLGLKYCCGGDLQQATIDFQILLLDMLENKSLCSTNEPCCVLKCNCYSIEVTQPMLDNAINNSNVQFNSVIIFNIRNCGDTDYTTLNIEAVGTYTYCLSCPPFIGYLSNDTFIELTQNITLNSVCDEDNPCI